MLEIYTTIHRITSYNVCYTKLLRAGAVAFSSIDTLLAPFIKEDNLSYEEIKQQLQNFIFSINSNSRGGAEPAFSNITLDLFPPSDLINQNVLFNGRVV